MLIIGIEGKELTANDRARLAAREVSGVILFTRNYADREQLLRLVASIREARGGDFLISVDHEGGPVQRFRAGFTRLPPLARIGELYRRDRAAAVALAEIHAIVMASELRACDIDISFAPVVDLARGNRVIGERAFDPDPAVVSELGAAYVRGMRLSGMAATIKHFPGHGSIPEDTHLEAAIDPRPLDAIRATDLVPFAEGLASGAEAVMVAHVTYPAVDPLAAGYSRRWIGDILRGEFGFRGVVFSDDVGMVAAESAGGIGARVNAHLDAGCDLVLVCHPAMVDAALDVVRGRTPCSGEKVAALAGSVAEGWDSMQRDPQYRRYVAALDELAAPAGTHA
ncbi:MAG: beta-N-acetylglucosaminidase [Rhodanobacteraceae bacterium]|jgi:beta-N-acetylhexosaminidase|nr:MAG: beta-N-acetylglucosaminidase [Rhodanobacteraceae bacterium]